MKTDPRTWGRAGIEGGEQKSIGVTFSLHPYCHFHSRALALSGADALAHALGGGQANVVQDIPLVGGVLNARGALRGEATRGAVNEDALQTRDSRASPRRLATRLVAGAAGGGRVRGGLLDHPDVGRVASLFFCVVGKWG